LGDDDRSRGDDQKPGGEQDQREDEERVVNVAAHRLYLIPISSMWRWFPEKRPLAQIKSSANAPETRLPARLAKALARRAGREVRYLQTVRKPPQSPFRHSRPFVILSVAKNPACMGLLDAEIPRYRSE